MIKFLMLVLFLVNGAAFAGDYSFSVVERSTNKATVCSNTGNNLTCANNHGQTAKCKLQEIGGNKVLICSDSGFKLGPVIAPATE